VNRPLSYLDYNAEAPLKPAVAEAMAAASGRVGNPSSVHRFGRLARRALEDVRARVGALAGADPAAVIFTSGGTEANNLALAGAAPERRVVSAVEHDSVLAASPGATVAAVNGDGVIDLAALDAALAADSTPALVSVMLANNETGVIQPVAAAAELAHAHGALLHCDAVQGAGRIPLSLDDLGADLMSLSAHKMGGPQGAGALIVRDGVAVSAMLRGGRQEAGRREEELQGALSRGEGTPPATGPRATITGERCNELLTEKIKDQARACAVALLRLGGLDRLIHLAASLAEDGGTGIQRQ